MLRRGSVGLGRAGGPSDVSLPSERPSVRGGGGGVSGLSSPLSSLLSHFWSVESEGIVVQHSG